MLNVSNIDDLTALVDLIANKIDSDDNSEECENVKNLSSFEKTVYCAFNYHLEQMNDGFVAVFTGYMSPLLYEIREALNQIGAEVNLELLNEAIKKVNVEGKSEEDFLIDVENEELDHLYDEETEDEYYDFLNNLDKKLYDCDKEDINELLIEYIKKAKEQLYCGYNSHIFWEPSISYDTKRTKDLMNRLRKNLGEVVDTLEDFLGEK